MPRQSAAARVTRHLPLLRDIDHILLAMPRGGEEAAREFYGRLLGLTEIEKPENLKRLGGVWFTLGDRQVHLGIEDEFRPAKKATRIAPVEKSLSVMSVGS